MNASRRCCAHCSSILPSKGYRACAFRSLFGVVPLRVRRFVACRCHDGAAAVGSFSTMPLDGGLAPELAYVTVKFAVLAPFAKVADPLTELLPIGCPANAGTVRNRTRRVGKRIARTPPAGEADVDAYAVTPPVVVGLDGGYVRSQHRRPERNFEVVAGKVLHIDGTQHRFAFARNRNSADELADAVVSAGVRPGTPSTVLCDGDAGLWALQRAVLPNATMVLDWFHVGMRFEHALQAARGLGARTTSGYLCLYPLRDLERSKWWLWHGRPSVCLGGLARLKHWVGSAHVRNNPGAAALKRHVGDLIEYLHTNRLALVNYRRRRHQRQPIPTAFFESAVNKILSKRMIKKQQMRRNRWTVQPFLDVRVAVLNATLAGSFRQIYPGFRLQHANAPAQLAA